MSERVAVEFTVEPFADGEPGPHVTAAVAAVQAFGVQVDFGPFGSMFWSTLDQVPEIVKSLVTAAYANGATHVNVHLARGDA
jgi:uncharacterized protein YqgV (UPF0045/DUF77 family)